MVVMFVIIISVWSATVMVFPGAKIKSVYAAAYDLLLFLVNTSETEVLYNKRRTGENT